MKINEMIFQYLQSKKKYPKNNNINSIENIEKQEISKDLINLDFNKNNEKEENKIIESSLIYVNQKLIQQNKELKEQLEIYKNNLDIYKQNKDGFDKIENNTNTIKYSFYEEKKKELYKTSNEKEEIIPTIASLTKQLDEYKKTEKIKKDKKKKRVKLKKTENLPNIEQYFICNNKFQLVDSDKNLFHMRKCLKFQEFKRSCKAANDNISSEDILKDFVDIYQEKDEEISDENDNLEANKTSSTQPNMENNSNEKEGNNEVNNGNTTQEKNNNNLQISNEENKNIGENNNKINNNLNEKEKSSSDKEKEIYSACLNNINESDNSD